MEALLRDYRPKGQLIGHALICTLNPTIRSLGYKIVKRKRVDGRTFMNSENVSRR